MEANLNPLPDVLEVVLKDLLLLCHYRPGGMSCLAILQHAHNKYVHSGL